jgi:MoaA/NifB/PqqE/SkfB family radical SAM enzyme
MQDNYGYELELPYVLKSKDTLTLRITDKHLLGSRRHFIRLDLYPLIAPSHLRRHYGWWDIPLRHIAEENTDLEFDFDSSLVRYSGYSGKMIEIKPGWASDLKEHGYITFHVSLWRHRPFLFGLRPAMIASKVHSVALTTADGDVSLQQITLPVTDRCNLKCKMCPRHSAPELIEKDMSEDILHAVLEVSPHIAEVCTQCLGEPLMNKDIYRIVRTVKNHMPPEGEVGCSTNGTLLNESNSVNLLDSGIDFLIFSLDGAERETVESIRIGVKFDTVIQSIKNCVKYRRMKGSKSPRILANFVMMQENMSEIPRFVSLCASLGVDAVFFSYSGDPKTGKFNTFGREKLEPLFEEARAIAVRRRMAIVLPPFERNNIERCYNMQHARILVSGEVRPCCGMLPGFDIQRKVLSFGNVKERPLIDIWNDPKYVHFRRQVVKGDFPDECTGCDFKTGLVF